MSLFTINVKTLEFDAFATLIGELMATLDDVKAAVDAQGPQLDAVVTAVAGIKAQLTQALSGTNVSPEVQAKIDAIFAGLQTNSSKISSI